jgi:hypothetical protein
LTTGTPAEESLAEWVGIDGQAGTSGATDLIQAGVFQSMVPCQGSSTPVSTESDYNPNAFYICPWTFFIENGSAGQGPIPQLQVNSGDSITVEIWLQSGTNWAISMDDSTSRQSWSIGAQYYGGPGSTAEWIVEDPGNVGQGCGIAVGQELGQCPMPVYNPPVAFSNVKVAPPTVGTWDEFSLVQNGDQLSTPSAQDSNADFTVTYTGLSAQDRKVALLRRALPNLSTPVLESTGTTRRAIAHATAKS